MHVNFRIHSMAIATVAVAGTSIHTQAAPITAGNPVVVRTDLTGLSSNPRGAATWLDEYDANTGAWVQSFALPTGAGGPVGINNEAFTLDGSTSEGVLSTTPDRSKIVFAGYRWTANSASNTILSATTPRAIGTLSSTGTLDTSFTALVPTSVLAGSNARVAASIDGSSFYLGTGYVGGTPTAGVIHYTTSGTTGTIVGGRNVRTLGIANIGGSSTLVSGDGQGGGAVQNRVLDYGGAPTSLVTPTTITPGGLGGAVQGFAFADLNPSIAGDDTLYLVQTSAADGGNGQGIQKYSYDGTSWSFVNTLAFANAFNLALFPTGSGVNLFVTTNNTGVSELYKLTDSSGYGGSLSGSPSQLTLGTPGAGFGSAVNGTTVVLRGVAVIPEPTSLAVLGALASLAMRRRSRR